VLEVVLGAADQSPSVVKDVQVAAVGVNEVQADPVPGKNHRCKPPVVVVEVARIKVGIVQPQKLLCCAPGRENIKLSPRTALSTRTPKRTPCRG
jgi:hypothetical protein